ARGDCWTNSAERCNGEARSASGRLSRMTKANFCSDCGEPLVRNANFCAMCGAAVRNADSGGEESQSNGHAPALGGWTRFVDRFTLFVDRALLPFDDLAGLGDFLEPDGPELSY